MNGNEWRNIDQTKLDGYQRRLALVETLLDDNIDEAERQQVRGEYRHIHGVSDRTIRNYIRRYRVSGALGPLFYRHHKARLLMSENIISLPTSTGKEIRGTFR